MSCTPEKARYGVMYIVRKAAIAVLSACVMRISSAASFDFFVSCAMN